MQWFKANRLSVNLKKTNFVIFGNSVKLKKLNKFEIFLAVTGQGAVASKAEIRKCTKYNHLAAMYNFVPVAVETLGSFGESTNNFIRVLGRKITIVMGEKRATDFLRQRLSVAIQCGNCCLCFGHR